MIVLFDREISSNTNVKWQVNKVFLHSTVASLHSTPVVIKLVSAKGCQGFRETKMRNGGTVLLAVQNLYVRV
jgi:hypothetical protein